eukprot:g323.t1
MLEAQKIQEEKGIHHLLLASESADVISEIKSEWGGNFTIHHCRWDRAGYNLAVTQGNSHELTDQRLTDQLSRIEWLVGARNVTAEHAVVSVVAETELLADSAILVHTGSTFAVLAAELAQADTDSLVTVQLGGVQATDTNTRVLQTLVDPVPLDTFFSDYYGKKFLHSPHNKSSFDSQVVLQQMNDVFSNAAHSTSHHQPTLDSVHDPILHALVSQSKPAIDSRKEGEHAHVTITDSKHAEALLNTGHSIIINAFHNIRNRPPAMQALIKELVAWDSRHLGINAYIGGMESHALPPHSDRTDVMILNVRGSKKWRICTPKMGDGDASKIATMRATPEWSFAQPDMLRFTDADLARLADLRHHKKIGCINIDRRTFRQMENCKLVNMKGGDFLYIPKGMLHEVTAAEELSIHMTISFNPETWLRTFDDLVYHWPGSPSFPFGCTAGDPTHLMMVRIFEDYLQSRWEPQHAHSGLELVVAIPTATLGVITVTVRKHLIHPAIIVPPEGSITNTGSERGATLCSQCSAGKYSVSGKYQNEQGKPLCKACPGGKFGSAQALKHSDCSGMCKEGHYCPAESKSATEKVCGVGTYCAPGSSIPQPATVGVWVDSKGQQHDCPAGYKCSAGNKTACSRGEYQDKTKQFMCKLCEAGKFVNQTNSTACKQCPAGRHSSVGAKDPDEDCKRCDAGKFQSQAGQSSCVDCAAETYQDKSGGSVCKTCAKCTNNEYRKRQGCAGASGGFCTDCGPGKFVARNGTDKVGKGECAECAIGFFANDNNLDACMVCPEGKWQQRPGRPFCDDVKPGKRLQPKINKTTLEPLLDKKTGEPVLEEVECPAGEYNQGGTSGQCAHCPRGYVQKERGRSSCDECSLVDEYIRRVVGPDGALGPDNETCVDCPSVGVECNGREKKYTGNVWHNVSIINPSASTNMYSCVTAGCPSPGETEMKCKDGFKPYAPLCALCDEGYWAQLRECFPCEKPNWGGLVLCAVLGMALLASGLFLLHKYGRILHRTNIWAHVKIIISFVMVACTVDTQFGVVWPYNFLKALDILSLLSFDFGVMAGIFCIVQMDFYDSLLSMTSTLLMGFSAIMGTAKFFSIRAAKQAEQAEQNSTKAAEQVMQQGRFFAGYLLLFAFPIVSVDLVEAFACHEVEGTFYLRVDYSIECYTPRFYRMSGYAALWLIGYVVVFPLVLFWKLWTYKVKLLAGTKQLHELRYGFLIEDYKPYLPCLMWEWIEMMRKLFLSVVGAMWSTKSTMCVATAMVISVVFYGAHCHFYPFRSMACNRLQTLCLTVLSIVYFVGVLLKTETVETKDREDLGWLLIALLVSILISFCLVMWVEFKAMRQWLQDERRERENAKRVEAFESKHDEEKDADQLRKVVRETKAMLGRMVEEGTVIAVTCFRKGGPNNEHQFLHEVRACLRAYGRASENKRQRRSNKSKAELVSYVHYQSSFENSLFGWSSANCSTDGKPGDIELDSGETYSGLDMERYWYASWLEVIAACSSSGGWLIVFDLPGDAALNTSVDCAMELLFLYRHFKSGDSNLRLVVLQDKDVVFDNTDELARIIETKLGNQLEQELLFQAAYEKCLAFFSRSDLDLQAVGQKWLHDHEAAGGSKALDGLSAVMEKIRVAERTDPLTKLLNRRAFDDDVEAILPT